ncbi:YcaO-like family protein [Hamadaea sp. NPDC051192]|uniref:YcaO-like family protein n=1 Tax=Hamadaea sp. NPDC051192 TaxID=3154940 RepID=UPI0034162E52
MSGTVLSCRTAARTHRAMDAWGRAGEADLSWRVSVIEALERLATASEPVKVSIGTPSSVPFAVDWRGLPRHSDREIARNPSSVANLDQDTEIRWVDGVDLNDGSPVRLPAIMVYLGGAVLPAERFWTPISTGAAAGGTREDALFSAICEVIERDMNSVLWLQRLALPRIDVGDMTPDAVRLVRWCERKYMRAHVFDATSEIGVPTAYCLLEAPHDAVVGRVVAASTNVDRGKAVEHALGEAVSIHTTLRFADAGKPEEVPLIVRGALQIAGPDHHDAFDFLLNPAHPRPVRPVFDHQDLPLTGPGRLANLVRRCERAGHKVYAVDLTTPESEQIGLHVVRVIIPSLQPLGFNPDARYLGHPRLYSLPALLGYPVSAEEHLNHLPQPFG